MSIVGISGSSVAMHAQQTRTQAADQIPADPVAATPPAAAASPPGTSTEAATAAGTLGALSPSVLAALMGQEVNLTAGSFAGA